jgi:hypothetical protein
MKPALLAIDRNCALKAPITAGTSVIGLSAEITVCAEDEADAFAGDGPHRQRSASCRTGAAHESDLFVVPAQNLPGHRIYEVDPLACRASEGFIGIAIRHFLGNESLDTIARSRAAVEKWWHHPLPIKSCLPVDSAGPPFLTLNPEISSIRYSERPSAR